MTGLGLVTALGATLDETWESLLAGRCGIGRLTVFSPEGYRTATAAEIRQLPPLPSGTITKRISRADHVALVATAQAFADSGFVVDRDAPRHRVGVLLGGGVSGLPESETYFREVLAGHNRPRPSLAMNHPPDNTTDVVARQWGLLGPRCSITTACSSSAIAVGYAADLIRYGLADAMLVGGSDVVARLTYGGFNSLRSVDPDPCRPFDVRRKGLSLGEAGGFLVLEREGAARARGARIRARYLGYGITSDAWHMTQPDPSGNSGGRTYRSAVEAARIDPSDVDHVNAHATATPQNDPAEALAIRSVFGEKPLVNSVKGALGHTLCAAGGVEAVLTVKTLEARVIPPTVGCEEQDPACPVTVVKGEPREVPSMKVAVSSSFAFGGNSAALVFGRFE